MRKDNEGKCLRQVTSISHSGCVTGSKDSAQKSYLSYSWDSDGQMNALFASTYQALVHPLVISSQPFSLSSYSPLNTNKINLVFGIWAQPRQQDRKSGGKVACITNAVKHCLKSAWPGERRDLGQKGKLWTLSQSLFESIKSKQSFLYKIHHTQATTACFHSNIPLY